MHELAICQDVILQLERLASEHQATKITEVLLEIGPLSGVEPPLLQAAYSIASADSIAAGAILKIETSPVRVYCQQCGKASVAKVNQLLCGHCGDWHTELISGDQMTLKHVEMESD